MCGCEHHWDTNAPCTCTCPEHEPIREEMERRTAASAPSDLAGLLAEHEPWRNEVYIVKGCRCGERMVGIQRQRAHVAAVIVRDWLPEHDRTVRAEALRGFDTDEMAEALGGKSAWLTSASHVANIVRHWLDEEADRIESNESEGRP